MWYQLLFQTTRTFIEYCYKPFINHLYVNINILILTIVFMDGNVGMMVVDKYGTFLEIFEQILLLLRL